MQLVWHQWPVVKYAEPSRLPGELSITEAATELGAHRNTIYRWCQCAVAGDRAPLTKVRRDRMGHYWLDGEEVRGFRRRDLDV